MSNEFTTERYKLGDQLTQHELREVYRRIFNTPMPRNLAPRDVATQLARARGLRMEFEVNRLRGFAWDHEEIGK